MSSRTAASARLSISVEFLGRIVSASGFAVDPDKTATVMQWPRPANKWEVQQFLGLANYYFRFVRDFAHYYSWVKSAGTEEWYIVEMLLFRDEVLHRGSP